MLGFQTRNYEKIYFPEENFSQEEYVIIHRFLKTEWERQINCHLSEEKRRGGSGEYDPGHTIAYIPRLSEYLEIAERGVKGESISSRDKEIASIERRAQHEELSSCD